MTIILLGEVFCLVCGKRSWNFLLYFSGLDNKAPKAEDIEEEDDDVPGNESNVVF